MLQRCFESFKGQRAMGLFINFYFCDTFYLREARSSGYGVIFG